MMQPTSPAVHGSPDVHRSPAASRLDAGAPSDWRRWRFTHPAIGQVSGKLFLGELLGLTGMEISLSSIAPGAGIPFLHRHRRNEEVYLFLSGRGEFQVDGERFPVEAGSVVRVAPEGARAYRNAGDEPLTFLVIQAPAGATGSRTIEDGEAVEGEVRW